MEQNNRAAGILLPVSSLPSAYGIGTLGRAAYRWIDFLRDTKQRYWQVLPLGPTGYGDSPYQSFSVYAGNPYYIDFDLLAEEGLLYREEYNNISWAKEPEYIDYLTIYQNREPVLRKAYKRFKESPSFCAFCEKNKHWLEDYALYSSIKKAMGNKSWLEWDLDLRMRDREAIEHYKAGLGEDIQFQKFVQFKFWEQWSALHEYAGSGNIKIIGDLPIYPAMDSADVWKEAQLFQFDERRRPTDVAGCPPDAFSEDGQLWGNPLYNWEAMHREDYRWWVSRLKHILHMFDIVRIDHFRGLESYYAVPFGNINAREGEWRKGPGKAFIDKINSVFEHSRFIAEDLGYLTGEVISLLQHSGYPGMKVLQFAFDSREKSDHMPHNFQRHCVVYTGTHDNNTVAGWFHSAEKDDVELAGRYLGIAEERHGNDAFIRAAMCSVSDTAIIPIQDYLGLGSEARLNVPSTLGGINWRWRLREEMLTDSLAIKIRSYSELSGRTEWMSWYIDD